MKWWNLILKALASAGAFFAAHWRPIAGLLAGWTGRGLVEDNKQLKTKVDGLEKVLDADIDSRNMSDADKLLDAKRRGLV